MFPEIIARDRAIFVVVRKVLEKHSHVTIVCDSDHELFYSCAKLEEGDPRLCSSRTLLLSTRSLNKPEEFLDSDAFFTTDSKLAVALAVKSVSNCSCHIGVVDWVELDSGFVQELRIQFHFARGALGHVVEHVGWVASINQVSVENGQLRVRSECLLFCFLALFNPRLLHIFIVNHVVLHWADSSQVLNSVLLSQLGCTDEELVLAGSHRGIVVCEVDHFVCSFQRDVERGSTVGLVLLHFNAERSHLTLEGIHRGLVRAEVEQPHFVVGTALGKASDNTL